MSRGRFGCVVVRVLAWDATIGAGLHALPSDCPSLPAQVYARTRVHMHDAPNPLFQHRCLNRDVPGRCTEHCMNFQVPLVASVCVSPSAMCACVRWRSVCAGPKRVQGTRCARRSGAAQVVGRVCVRLPVATVPDWLPTDAPQRRCDEGVRGGPGGPARDSEQQPGTAVTCGHGGAGQACTWHVQRRGPGAVPPVEPVCWQRWWAEAHSPRPARMHPHDRVGVGGGWGDAGNRPLRQHVMRMVASGSGRSYTGFSGGHTRGGET